MSAHRTTFWLGLVLGASACSGSESPSDAGTNTDGGMKPDASIITEGNYAYCNEDLHLGSFTVALAAGFSTAQGQIADAVTPIELFDVESSEGDCQLLRPPSLFCDPSCETGTTCSANGSCVALAENRDFGEFTLTGLSMDITVSAMAPVYFYSFRGTLPHPAFSAASTVMLSSDGGDFDAFSMSASGVDALQTSASSVAIAQGTGAALSWTPQATNDDVRVELELNLANHGGTPGRIRCLVADSGAFTIPSGLVDALLDGTASGFPSLRMTRRGSGAALSGPGCIELRLKSEVVLPVEIPGLISCSLPEDCPMGQTCLGDLTCG